MKWPDLLHDEKIKSLIAIIIVVYGLTIVAYTQISQDNADKIMDVVVIVVTCYFLKDSKKA